MRSSALIMPLYPRVPPNSNREEMVHHAVMREIETRGQRVGAQRGRGNTNSRARTSRASPQGTPRGSRHSTPTSPSVANAPLAAHTTAAAQSNVSHSGPAPRPRASGRRFAPVPASLSRTALLASYELPSFASSSRRQSSIVALGESDPGPSAVVPPLPRWLSEPEH